jgi:hypothetical protein
MLREHPSHEFGDLRSRGDGITGKEAAASGNRSPDASFIPMDYEGLHSESFLFLLNGIESYPIFKKRGLLCATSIL